MSTKRKPGEFDCLDSALPDEPYFVLLARDQQGAGLVLLWAAEREAGIGEGRFPEADRAKVDEARRIADDMKIWRAQNDGLWRQNNPELPFEGATQRRAAIYNGEV